MENRYIISDTKSLANGMEAYVKCFSDDMTCAFWTGDINKAMLFDENSIMPFLNHNGFTPVKVIRATQIIK